MTQYLVLVETNSEGGRFITVPASSSDQAMELADKYLKEFAKSTDKTEAEIRYERMGNKPFIERIQVKSTEEIVFDYTVGYLD